VPNEPATDFLDSIRAESGRVCPLECGAREIDKDGHCIAKNCPSGSTLDAGGACEKRQQGTKSASRSPEKVSSNPTQDLQAEHGTNGQVPSKGLLRSEPPRGAMKAGETVLVDVGNCGQGHVMQVVQGVYNRHLHCLAK
jgi:hypothetical protein